MSRSLTVRRDSAKPATGICTNASESGPTRIPSLFSVADSVEPAIRPEALMPDRMVTLATDPSDKVGSKVVNPGAKAPIADAVGLNTKPPADPAKGPAYAQPTIRPLLLAPRNSVLVLA